MRSTGVGRAATLVAALALGCGAPDPRPSFLVVSLDTQRADHLGSYGGEAGLTPALDGLATRAVRFANAVAPMATTFPSHATMFTGTYPRRHGVRWNRDALGEAAQTLAERLGAAGYDTGAFVSYRAMLSKGGFAQGFEALSDEVDGRPHGIRDGAETVELATEWLAGRGRAPFLLWVHLYEPHGPYPVTQYARERLGAYRGPLADGASIEEVKALGKRARERPEDVAALRALYAGRVRDADALVGRLLGALAEHDLAARTTVVVVGDHGELLGEHDGVGHGPTLWEEALRVPFLVAQPGAAARVVDERVGLVDLAPTLLELSGQPAPPELDGRSLVPALRGEVLPTRAYFAEVRARAEGEEARELSQRQVVVWRGPHKLWSVPRGERLYDLAADPSEEAPLAAGAVPELAQLARQHAAGGAPEAAGPVDAETLEELRALGYAE